jgi:signal peptidase
MTDEENPTVADAAAAEPTGPEQTDPEPSGRLTLRRTAAVLGALLVVAAVVPFVVFAVPQTVGADHGFVILSGSMEPALSPGDVVIVSGSASVQVGDVITFDDGNSVPTTHRVVGVEDGQYVTKGDANENADSRPVAPADVLGRVVLTLPLIGYVVLWANTPLGYVSLVVVPLVLLGASELYTWSRDGDADDRPDADAVPDANTDAVPHVDSRADDEADTVRTSELTTVRANERAERTEPEATAEEADRPAPGGRIPVATADLKLTTVATGVLFLYAAWTVYGEVANGVAPHPFSVAVLTGGFLGVVLAAWTTVSAVRARRHAASERQRRESRPESPTQVPRSDGGTDTEAES